jgi:hypothetical protein
MFKHPKVIPITALTLDSKEPLPKQPIPPLRMRIVTRMPIRQTLAAAHSDSTPTLEDKPQRAPWSARTRGKILYMPKRSSDDSCNT